MLQQKRSDTLWRLANDLALGDRAFVHGALGLGAALMVPGQPFGAQVGRVVGPILTIEGAHLDRLPFAARRAPGIVRIDAAHAQAIRRLVTQRWDDAGAGALLVTPFNAGHALYVLSIFSPVAARRPLTDDDEAFAESIARLIAERVQTKWDAVAAREPLEVISL